VRDDVFVLLLILAKAACGTTTLRDMKILRNLERKYYDVLVKVECYGELDD
jgi:hypothetical protein